jgi:hypothetical protein
MKIFLDLGGKQNSFVYGDSGYSWDGKNILDKAGKFLK